MILQRHYEYPQAVSSFCADFPDSSAPGSQFSTYKSGIAFSREILPSLSLVVSADKPPAKRGIVFGQSGTRELLAQKVHVRL